MNFKPDPHILVLLFTGLFFSILFLQSGIDKIRNRKAELEFNKKHFSKTFLSPVAFPMLIMLTAIELSSGLLSAAGIYWLLTGGGTIVSFYASCLCATTFICLFFGQRIAKDYGGAQSLVSYFIVSLIGIYLSSQG